MIRRALLLLLLPAAALGACAAPRPQAQMHAPVGPAPSAARAVTLAHAMLERLPESAPVTEDKPDPEAQRLFQARIAQAPIPLQAAASPPRVTAIALDDTRRGEAPGMTPAGEIFTATLAEGQRAAMPIKLAPGACETFIAQGGLGVIEVDLFLTEGEGAAGHLLAEDAATGPIAVIGGHGKCVGGAGGKGIDGMLHAAVRRGAGVILVRAYKK